DDRDNTVFLQDAQRRFTVLVEADKFHGTIPPLFKKPQTMVQGDGSPEPFTEFFLTVLPVYDYSMKSQTKRMAICSALACRSLK
ncbi:hypothetical protein, partial [Anaeromusa sp.]|uniref:hypothetical protein n=1 Tax=Anaeromusa sp. TaxID=1872520 RepID=UPI00261081BC